MIELNVNVVGPDGQPVPNPIITLYVLDVKWHECPMEPRIRQQANFFASPVSYAQATGATGPFSVYASVMAAGFNPAYVPMQTWAGASTLNIPVSLTPFKKPVVVVVRAPLPAFDPDSTDPETGAPLPVHKTVTAQPPAGPDVDFMRANLWGLTLPGLEAIPGGASGAAQNRMLTYLFNRYSQSSQDRGIDTYASYGYTHWWMSWPDARATGQSIADYVADCKRIQRRGVPYIGHMLRSKDFDGANPDPDGVNDVINALLAAGAMQHASPAWEASLFNSPEHFRDLIHHDAALLVPHGVSVDIHLQAGYADFGPDGHGHGPAFWQDCISVGVKRLLYQYDPAWSAGMQQARGNDVSSRLIQGGLWGLPETVQWDAFELCGVPLFNNGVTGDGRLATEDTADLLGYEMMCTPGPLPPSGYGNGCRRPDGTMF